MGLKTESSTYVQPVKLKRADNISGIDSSTDKVNKTTPEKKVHCPEELLQAEMNYIRAWRSERGNSEHEEEKLSRQKLTGLALSGGGIRSATFSLGVMQAMASRNLLKRMDYLSTVSGGGYIGSTLTWLLSNKAYKEQTRETGTKDLPRFGVDKEDFPMGTDDPDPVKPKQASPKQQRMLDYLRDHGFYLTPGSGINAFSLLGVVLRGTFLNVTMWMPVFILFFVFGLWFFAEHHPDEIYILSLFEVLKSSGTVNANLFGFELFLWGGLGLLSLLSISTLAYSLMTWLRREKSDYGLVGFWYEARRLAEKLSAMILAIILLLLLVGFLPVVAAYLKEWLAAGPIAMLSGMAIAMRDFMKPSGDVKSSSSSVLPPIAAGLFIFGGFIIAYELAQWIAAKPWMLIAVVVMLLFSIIMGWFVNLNYISIHRYYRDRLMETFMPDIVKALDNETMAAKGANTAKLTDFSYQNSPPRGPYHIVNTNVVLDDSKKQVYKNRGGDSFMLSPLFCGSSATGWCPTSEFVGGKMTLATAVAISGAAANPNTGVGGVGVTRNRMVSFVMSLLNLGLGYWAEHPNSDKSVIFQHPSNHFHPGLYSFGNLVGLKGFNEDRAFLQLSDGGHFENMGVYELIRRQTRLIIVCDGGADPEFSFSDFQTTVRRIEDDFGARIKVLDDASPDQLVPVAPKEGQGVYPKEAKFAQQGHMMAHILYEDDTEGWIIFLKTTLIEEVSFKVKGYAAQNKDFPDQSTIDQFFDEVQFEAYRELGYRLTIKMLESDVPQGVSCEAHSLDEEKNKHTLEDFIKKCSV